SDAMQQVATEAQAVTLARQELADQEIAGLVGTPPVAPVARPAAQPVAKSLLVPQTPVQEAPREQQVGQSQGRQWWRNT
ncbi:MAG: hypothetical protein H7Z41_01475, partial [Cytophagales bacterium]|nr:hypothetical protein [Armatimonadota bacterium]